MYVGFKAVTFPQVRHRDQDTIRHLKQFSRERFGIGDVLENLKTDRKVILLLGFEIEKFVLMPTTFSEL